MERRLKILFVSMHCRPEPCDTRTSQLARAMAERGHEATILTSFPNYPFGKTYPGYRQRLVQRERTEGVEIVRVPMIPDHSKSKLRRALSYLSFGFSAAILGALFTKRPDVIWIHHPPLTTGVAGWFLARLKRVPYIYEIHDLWPESLTSTGMVPEGRLTETIRRVCDRLHRRAHRVVVTSSGMKRHLAAQGLPAERIDAVPQWADESIFKPTEPLPEVARSYGLTGRFNIVYGGNIGVAQNLDAVVEAARRLKELPDVQFVMVGAGLDLARLREVVESEGLANIRFLGQHPPEAMPSIFAHADALLLQLKADPLFEITIPSKLQTYLAMGRPLLCGVDGETQSIVEQAGVGLGYRSDEPAALVAAVRAMRSLPVADREAMARRARETYLRRFSHAVADDRYEGMFLQASGRVERPAFTHAAVEVSLESERAAA